MSNDYKKLFPEIVTLRENVIHDAHRNGYTQTYLGRKRKLQSINSTWQAEMEKEERRAFNSAIQSSCADFLKIAAFRCYDEFKDMGVRCAFTVFDSFLLEVPEDMKEEDMLRVADRMSDFSDIVPEFKLRYDWSVGSNWKECQDKA